MASRFVAPKRIESLEDVRKALQLIQEQFDHNGISRARGQLVTNATTLVAGEFVRLSPRQGQTLFAKLPKASAENIGERITLSIERPDGTVRVSAQAPDTVVGVRATDFTTAGLVLLESNGVDQWVSINQLPSTSPGGAALDAEYILAEAHPSLPNGVAPTLANQVPVASSATGAAWDYPVEGLSDGVSLGRFYAIDVIGGRFTAVAGEAELNLLTGQVSEVLLAGTVNNKTLPAGIKHGDVWATGGLAGATTLTGIDATGIPDGFEFVLSWGNGGFPDGNQLTIVDESGSSTAGNRFATPDNVSMIVGTGGSIRFLRVGSPAGGRWVAVERGFPRASTSIAYGGLSGREMQLQAAVAGAGMTMTSQVLNVIGSTSITVNANDIQRPALTGAITAAANSNATAFGALAAKSVLANATNASAVPAALAGTGAFQHLRVNSTNTGLEWAVLSLAAFPTMAAGSFLANVTAGVAVPTAHDLATFAGAGLTYTNVTGILAVGAGTHVTVNANDVTLNLATLVPAIDSASVVADGTVLERAALTGAITAAQDSNATVFGTAGDGLQGTGTASLALIGSSNNDFLVRSGGAWTVDNLGSGSMLANISEGPNSTGAGDQTARDSLLWLLSSPRLRIFDEDFQGNLTTFTGGFYRWSIVSGFAGVALGGTNADLVGGLILQNTSPNGTTRGIFTLGVNELAANFRLETWRYLGMKVRTTASSIVADTGFQCGLVNSFAAYGAGTAGISSTSIGVWWQYRTDASSGEWVAGTRQGGSDSSTASGTVVAGSVNYLLEIIRTSSGELHYYLDGALVRSDSTAGTLALSGQATLYFTQIGSTTATRNIQVEWVRCLSMVP